jgi:hypothetical protein
MPRKPNIKLLEAKAAGEIFYRHDKPCIKGHYALRYVSNNECTDCISIRTSSPEFQKKEAERSISYYYANKDLRRMSSKKWAEKNLEKRLKSIYAWRERNKDAVKNIIKKSRTRRKGHINFINAKRRAQKLQATPSWLSAIEIAQIQEMYDVAIAKSTQTGIKHHVDHIIPLKNDIVCGLHVPWNLQVIPAIDNIRKSNKLEVSLCP